MKDAEFKSLRHPVGDFEIVSKGDAVAPGYKPDVTIADTEGVLRFILECEQKTDRKAFLGDLLKAEVFAEQSETNPELIIVMRVYANTTTRQIADHLRPYKDWLSEKKNGDLSVSAVHIISDKEYLEAIEFSDELGSIGFKNRGHEV